MNVFNQGARISAARFEPKLYALRLDVLLQRTTPTRHADSPIFFSSSSLRLAHGKPNREGGPFALFALDRNGPPISGDDLLDDAEPKSGPSVWVLCCDKRVEDPGHEGLRNSATAVTDMNCGLIRIHRRRESQETFSVHRLRGIADEIYKQLVDLSFARTEGRNRLERRDDFDIAEV